MDPSSASWTSPPHADGAHGPAAKVADLPSPARTWEESKLYILQPLEKRGEMEPVTGVPRVSLVFQNYSLLPWCSALENVRLAIAGRRARRRHHRRPRR
jgi:hypothetical protein